MNKKIRVVFVCLGNICRSPLAEAIFKHKVKQRKLGDHIEGDSCGTANYHIGHNPDPRTIANAKKNGVEIEHCGRQLSVNDLEDFDYVLAMDNSNFNNIHRILKDEKHKPKIQMMRDYDPKGKGEVPDPYYGDERNFQEVFEILDRTMNFFLDKLEREMPLKKHQ